MNEERPIGERVTAGGMCLYCRKKHFLAQGPAREACERLMQRLEANRHIDFFHAARDGVDPVCSTVPLFGAARGKMFGALTGIDLAGKEVEVYAFSGQFNGLWSVKGWAEPVFDPEAFHLLTCDEEKKIKRLGRWMEEHAKGSEEYNAFKLARKEKSRELMSRIHRLYTLKNFHGRTMPLVDVFPGSGEPPTGTGDCCAPKLLNHAVRNRIRPTGLAEFYWGRENKSQSRLHGRFYPPCSIRCEPILGFLLCGLHQ